MRDNLMVGLPQNSLSPEPLPAQAYAVGMPSSLMATYDSSELGMGKSILISVGLHALLVILCLLTLFILQLLGLSLLTFDRPERVKDIEFQLVEAPDETPRNPRTKNRAEHNTRAGGQRIPNMREAQTMQKAGRPQASQRQQAQAAKQQQRQTSAQVVQQQRPQPQRQPQQRPQPPRQPQPKRQVAQQPQQQQQQQPQQQVQQPAPPRPRVTAPKPSTSRQRIAALPNPLSPVRVPNPEGPVADTGPVVRGPAAGGGSPSGASSGASGNPATMPGQFSSGGGGGQPGRSGNPGGAGGPSGQGGRGSYSQYGSPGGGGGRPGIDAIAEPDFGPYLAELQRRIRRNWTPPEDKEDKTVVMMFTIAKDGRLLSISTKRSSGFGNADAAARVAIERSAPFRPLPAEYRDNSINVEFRFDYNVFAGRGGGISRH